MTTDNKARKKYLKPDEKNCHAFREGINVIS